MEKTTTLERKELIKIPSEDIAEWKDQICEILMDCDNIPESVVFTDGSIRITYTKEWDDE